MRFRELAEIFELLEKTTSRLRLTGQLAKMYSEADAKIVKHLTYLCQGMLVPEFEGIQLGIGDKLAERAISRVSGKSIREIEEAYRKEGDLGLAASKLLEKKAQATLLKEDLTTKRVYENFYKIATSAGGGSQDLKIQLLAELLSNAEPAEAKHVVRFAQGNLRLGIGEPTILDALSLYWIGRLAENAKEIEIAGKRYAVKNLRVGFGGGGEEKKGEASSIELICGGKLEAAMNVKKGAEIGIFGREKLNGELLKIEENGEKYRITTLILEEKRRFRDIFERAYNMRSDLGEVTEFVFAGRIDELLTIKPKIFSPIRPALAERLLTPEQIIEKIGKCSVEGKYDGLRLQLHKKENEVKIYSRKEEPMTHMFPDLVEAVRKEIRAKDVIFEGEAIAYDEKQKRFLPFQVTIQRKRKHLVGEKAKEIPLKLFAFELLYSDGKDYTREPYEERREQLGGMIEKDAKTILLANRIIAEKPEQLQKFFEKCLSEGLEGIIAKDLRAPYVAGARKFAWIKLKKSYGKISDTLDVVIIGYYFGKGKRTQFEFGGVLTAVYDAENERYRSIAKVGTGFSEEQMEQFAKMLEKIAVKEKPGNVDCDMKPDVWVEPKIVIEVNADEITRSPTHTAGKSSEEGEGFALRFPRMISLRTDKKPQDATTEAEIFEMYELQQQK